MEPAAATPNSDGAGQISSLARPNSNEKIQSSSKSHGQKRKWEDHKTFKQGSRRNKGKDMGRGEYFRQNIDKRGRNDEEHAKSQRKEENGDSKSKSLPKPFSQEEIEADSRKPKRKVAVMIGYSGSGYKGMQMMPNQKTIEGDLFAAFVAAGAISKANADDPKKSSFVRCARTDKGVHAAGNVISLKLIIEDSGIVKRINDALSPQIRVWGIERTIGSFSCYQACDSRCFMGRKLVELAEEAGDMDGYTARQEEVADFWDNNERSYIQPLLKSLDESIRGLVEEALYKPVADRDALEDDEDDVASLVEDNSDINDGGMDAGEESIKEENQTVENMSIITEKETLNDEAQPATGSNTPDQAALNAAIKALKVAYIKAKHAYRISPARLARVREIFAAYKGTHNFHNYTVRKSANDPSAKRHILSFSVSPEPILIGDTEWLSLKVHGQSFMMHQIRKMVGMATLMVRCGTPVERLNESFTSDLFSIPKAPGLGLLLERPVFDNYNQKATEKFERAQVEFTKYEKEIEEFKRREIYNRIFREEEEDHVFHSFFSHIDNFKESTFLFLSSKGLEACGPARDPSDGQRQLSRKQRKGLIKRKWSPGPRGRTKADAKATSANETHKVEAKDDTKTQDGAVGGIDVTLGVMGDYIKDFGKEAEAME